MLHPSIFAGMRHLLLLLFLLSSGASFAQQSAWWIYFIDKQGSTFDPYAFFDPAAIARREKNGISLYDDSDYPVSPVYLQQIAGMVDTMGYASRWLNAVGVVAAPEQITAIQSLSFVRSVQRQAGFEWQCTAIDAQQKGEATSTDPLAMMQAEQFAAHGITGKGINIAILDAGFAGVNTHEAFADLRFNHQIKRTWNFLQNDSLIYGEKTDHGAMVLSCIAGNTNQQQLGMATGANFMLAIISKEYGNQYRAEEHYIAGVEWADRVGAHIINISGGPNENAYFPEQMDGKTSIISFACKVAARKGILVVAAAGNNGEKISRQLLPPAETDSVLSVTAISTAWIAARYSAIGPPPDFRRKPDICAPGDVYVACREKGEDAYAESDGTSFSAPLVTGFAACLMQLYPSITAMGTIDTLHHCAHLYPYYDYSHGYGVPQADYFFRTDKATFPTFIVERDSVGIKIRITPNADTLTTAVKDRMLFWNLTDSRGRIIEYRVIEVMEPVPMRLDFAHVQQRGEYKLCIWFKGYYAETDF
jgi:serine protease AprX